MSEMEISKAKSEVERSVADFERALDKLMGKVESGVEQVDLSARVRELVDVDSALERAKESATDFITSFRKSAEQEFEKLDKKPLFTFGAVLVSGLALGYVLAKKTSSH